MVRNKYYVVRKLADVIYALPVGVLVFILRGTGANRHKRMFGAVSVGPYIVIYIGTLCGCILLFYKRLLNVQCNDER